MPEITIKKFINAQQKSRSQCGDIKGADIEGKTYCLASVTDLSHRILFGQGVRSQPTGIKKPHQSFSERGERSSFKEVDFLLPNQDNVVIEINDKLLHNKSMRTKQFVCNTFRKGIEKGSSRERKLYANRRYGQCIRGIELMKRNLT